MACAGVIERASVKLEGVTNLGVKTVDGAKVGLIRMKQFSTTTAADVGTALGDLTKQVCARLRVGLWWWRPGLLDGSRWY